MTRTEFASGRLQLPFTNANISISSGGTTSTHTRYFYTQGENAIGRNLPSAIVGPVNVPPGSKLTITLPPETKLPGEAWTAIVISASPTNILSAFTQIARLQFPTALPATVELDNDEALTLSKVVPSPVDLLTNPIDGQLRGVASLGYVFEFDARSAATSDNALVLPAINGRWHRRGVLFETSIGDVQKTGGCAVEIEEIEETTLIRTPKYACDRSVGTPVRYWIKNDTSSAIAAGKRVGLLVRFNGETKSQLFDGLLRLTFRGYSNTVTGTLRTTYAANGLRMEGVDQEVLFSANKSNLILQDALLPDEAYTLDCAVCFDPSDLGNQVPQNAIISVMPFFYAQAGSYSEAGRVTGDLIYGEGNQRVVLPGLGLTAKAMDGSGMVDSFSFLSVPESLITGFALNTANQVVAIDHDGNVRARIAPVPATEAIRAIVGTIDGVGGATELSPSVVIAASSSLDVTCTYPFADGAGRIRTNYPDALVAGKSAAFNPTGLKIYVVRLSDGEIRSFGGFAVTPESSRTFTISSWAAGTPISTIPTPETSFGLYMPVSTTLTSTPGATDLVEGDYQAAIAFEYTNTITSISHDEARGCLLTLTADLSTTLTRSKYWAEAVSDLGVLRQLPEAEISPHQTRYVISQNNFYRYEPNITAVDDGVSVIKPSAQHADASGRFINSDAVHSFRRNPTEALILSLVSVPPITGSNEMAIFADAADLKIKVRAPNSGAITLFGIAPTSFSWESADDGQWETFTNWENIN